MHRKPFRPARSTTRRAPRSSSTLAGVPEQGTETVLLVLGQAIELRDPTTAGHCERLALHSLALGLAMGLSRGELLSLYRGGFLHDIGKVGIPDAILFKPSALSEEEWDTMRQHPLIGEEICRRMRTLEPVLPIIRSHHERWDGGGYPDGLRKSEIPLLARVLQFADIYDALTTSRPYKRPFTPTEALAIMEEETSRGWRDPELMSLFLRMHRGVLAALEDCPPGSGDLLPMEESLARLERRLAADSAMRAQPLRTVPGGRSMVRDPLRVTAG